MIIHSALPSASALNNNWTIVIRNGKKNGVSGSETFRYRRDSKSSSNAKGGWEAQYPEEEVSAGHLRSSNAIDHQHGHFCHFEYIGYYSAGDILRDWPNVSWSLASRAHGIQTSRPPTAAFEHATGRRRESFDQGCALFITFFEVCVKNKCLFKQYQLNINTYTIKIQQLSKHRKVLSFFLFFFFLF